MCAYSGRIQDLMMLCIVVLTNVQLIQQFDSYPYNIITVLSIELIE